jgi:hypothetical protein
MRRRKPKHPFHSYDQTALKYRVTGTWPDDPKPAVWTGNDRAQARRVAKDMQLRGAQVTTEQHRSSQGYRTIDLLKETDR